MANPLQKESELWYKKQMKEYRRKNDPEYVKMQRRAIRAGSFISFDYNNPKTALSRLRFFDSHPVDVILDIRGNDMLCLNFHYAPKVFRKSIIAFIFKLNKLRIKNDKRFELEYKQMKEYITRNGLEMMIKRYKINRITNLKYIPTKDIKYIAELPSEKFVLDGRMSEQELYAMIRSHGKKTKGAKNTRFGRNTNK